MISPCAPSSPAPSNSSGSAWSPALSTNPKVVKFLTTVRNNMLRMSEQRLKQVVLELVRELIVAKQRNLYLWRVTQERSRAIRHLQEILNQMQAGAGNASSGASPAPGDGGRDHCGNNHCLSASHDTGWYHCSNDRWKQPVWGRWCYRPNHSHVASSHNSYSFR